MYREINKQSIIILGDLNITVSVIHRTTRQKKSVRMYHPLTGSNQHLIDKTHHPTIAEHTFFPSIHGTYTNINHILSHTAKLNRFKILL